MRLGHASGRENRHCSLLRLVACFFTLCPRNPSNSVNTGFSKCMKAADSWVAKADEATNFASVNVVEDQEHR